MIPLLLLFCCCPPPAADAASRFRGRAPAGGHEQCQPDGLARQWVPFAPPGASFSPAFGGEVFFALTGYTAASAAYKRFAARKTSR